MNRELKCVVMILLAGFAGCSADQGILPNLTIAAINLLCQNAAATTVVPECIPADLAVVMADPARFDNASNPLAGVVVGTTVDDLAGLAGCWGRYTRQTIENAEAGQSAEAEEFAVLQFDLERQTVTLRRYFTMPSADSTGGAGQTSQALVSDIISDLPIFLTEVHDITSMTDNLLTLEGVSAEGAAVRADGQTVFSCLATMTGSLNSGATLRMLLTRQGDFLKEYDAAVGFDGVTSSEELIPAEADESADLWVRFDCSANAS